MGFLLQVEARDSSWKQQRCSFTSSCLAKLFPWLGLQSHWHVPTAGKAVRGGCPELWLSPGLRDPWAPQEAFLLSYCATKHGTWRGFGVSFSSLKPLSTSLGLKCVSGPLWLGKFGFSWGSPRGWSHPLSPPEQRGPFMPCPVQERDWPRIDCRTPQGAGRGALHSPNSSVLGRESGKSCSASQRPKG